MNIWDVLTNGMPQRYVAPDDCDFWFDGEMRFCAEQRFRRLRFSSCLTILCLTLFGL